MKILLDLNVLIDAACRWQRYPESLALYEFLAQGATAKGLIPGCGYTTLYYVLTKQIGENMARRFVARFSDTLEVARFDAECAAQALKLQFDDLEDACIAATALASGCDFLATRDSAGFAASPIPPRSPEQLLKRLNTTT